MSIVKIHLLGLTLALGIALPVNADSYPAACGLVQACVDQTVTAGLEACYAANPSCDLTQFKNNQTIERFGASSQQIATRAIEAKKCSRFTTSNSCKRCYNAAKRPLQLRFYPTLFRGLLGNAALLIQDEAERVCAALPSNGSITKQ